MDIIVFFETLAFAGAIALMAVVYREILLREPVLHWWAKFGERFENYWFHAPIWGCHKCIAGQLALWFYLGTHLPSYFKQILAQAGFFSSDGYLYAQGKYSFLCHLFAVCCAILFSDLLKTKLDKWI